MLNNDNSTAQQRSSSSSPSPAPSSPSPSPTSSTFASAQSSSTSVNSLPVLLPRPHPHRPIRAIDAETFADLHFKHFTKDVHDSLLFPFLHGLEDGNHAQTSFFEVTRAGQNHDDASARTLTIPRYRGLVWVACDTDDDRLSHDRFNPHSGEFDFDDDDDDFDFEYDDDYDGDQPETMQVDEQAPDLSPPQMHVHPTTQQQDGSIPQLHMHPEALRKPSAPIAINTHGAHSHSNGSNDAYDSHERDRRHSTSSSNSVDTDASHDSSISSSTSSSAESAVSDSAHSHYGFFGASASYSTTASSFVGSKDDDRDFDCSGRSSNDDDTPTVVTPCTSPGTDIAIDDCIPCVPDSTGAAQTGKLSGDLFAQPQAETQALHSLISAAGGDAGIVQDLAKTSPRHKEVDLNGVTITSAFRPSDLLTTAADGSPMFVPPRVPEGISLRNFGIQVPIYATLSDVVIFSPHGLTRTAFAQAEKFKLAIERKAAERKERIEQAGCEVVWAGEIGEGDEEVCGSGAERDGSSNAAGVDDSGKGKPTAYLVPYNVFILTDPLHVVAKKCPWLLSKAIPPGNELFGSAAPYTTPVASVLGTSQEEVEADVDMDLEDAYERERQREHERDVYGGAVEPSKQPNQQTPSASSSSQIIPAVDFAQRERDEMRELTRATAILTDVVYLGNVSDVPIPRPHRIRNHGQASGMMMHDSDDEEDLDPFDGSDNPAGYDVCIECRDYAPMSNASQLRAAEAHMNALDSLWASKKHVAESMAEDATMEEGGRKMTKAEMMRKYVGSRPAPSAMHVVHMCFPASPSFAFGLQPFLSFLSSLVAPKQHPPSTRQKRVLIYSNDGYTESSVLALCVLMKERGLDLPGAYLELQVEKGRSFFVYQSDLGVLKRVESTLAKEREAAGLDPAFRHTLGIWEKKQWMGANGPERTATPQRETGAAHPYARSPRNTISYSSVTAAMEDGHMVTSSSTATSRVLASPAQSSSSSSTMLRRPRAQTSPLLPPHVNHQTWFNDPRFDGSFPSRVLPFLYLGNLNHASNAYMLHALGITHVVSVGECALVPPVNGADENRWLLWTEEREGRIKVLDIKGVCDDGIDSLQHQLAPICDWIERARADGGKILVHCRVGVSRSATVTIAYVMKHLNIPLVDAYLIVRSRRLNVLIQPNMRLLYNLCGWEVELARERAKGNVDKLRCELSKSLNWPFLAREVHRLNEKYLH